MKHHTTFLLLVLALVISGCTETRSISNSGYREPHSSARFAPRAGDSDPAFQYRGELSEFDVLGIERGAMTSDTEIERTLANAKRVRLKRGNSILLLQSGAIFPDGPM